MESISLSYLTSNVRLSGIFYITVIQYCLRPIILLKPGRGAFFYFFNEPARIFYNRDTASETEKNRAKDF